MFGSSLQKFKETENVLSFCLLLPSETLGLQQWRWPRKEDQGFSRRKELLHLLLLIIKLCKRLLHRFFLDLLRTAINGFLLHPTERIRRLCSVMVFLCGYNLDCPQKSFYNRVNNALEKTTREKLKSEVYVQYSTVQRAIPFGRCFLGWKYVWA